MYTPFYIVVQPVIRHTVVGNLNDGITVTAMYLQVTRVLGEI